MTMSTRRPGSSSVTRMVLVIALLVSSGACMPLSPAVADELRPPAAGETSHYERR